MVESINNNDENYSIREFSPRSVNFYADVSYDEMPPIGELHYEGSLNIDKERIRLSASAYGSGLFKGASKSSQILETAAQVPITVASFGGGKGLSPFYEDWKIAFVGISLKEPDNEKVWNELRFALPGAYWFRPHFFTPNTFEAHKEAGSKEPEIFHTFTLKNGFTLDFCRQYVIVDGTGKDEVFFNLKRGKPFSINEAQNVAIYPLEILWGFAFQEPLNSNLLSGISDGNLVSIYDLENPWRNQIFSKFQGPFFSWIQEYFDNYEKFKRSIHLLKKNTIGSLDLISSLSGLISEIEPASKKLNRPQVNTLGKPKDFKEIVSDFSAFVDLKSFKKPNNWQLRIKQHRDYFQHGDESNVNLVDESLDEALALWILLKFLFFKAFWTKYFTDPSGPVIWKIIEKSDWAKASIKKYESIKSSIKNN